MPEFLAETYAPAGAAGAAAPCAADVALAAGQVSQDRVPVRFLGGIAVPEDEICFWLYQAPSAGAVCAAMTRAGLRPDRITPAISISLPDPPAGAESTTGAAPSPDPEETPCHPPPRNPGPRRAWRRTVTVPRPRRRRAAGA